ASMEKLLPANQREAKSIITSKCERWGYNTAYKDGDGCAKMLHDFV
ncbi:hypothetical protein FHS78_003720, partial [Parvibaculum indicum]|nr:hypothetical protein [Parvibaculum indicum]